MKKNNRGVTIIEIIISIALISIIMIFLFRVLISLTKDEDERLDTNAKIMAGTIMKAIQNDIVEKELTTIVIKPEYKRTNPASPILSTNTILYFGFADNSYKELVVDKSAIKYWNFSDKETHKITDFIKVGNTNSGDSDVSEENQQVAQEFYFELDEIELNFFEYNKNGSIYDGFFSLVIPFTDDYVTYKISLDFHYISDHIKIYRYTENADWLIEGIGNTTFTTNERVYSYSYKAICQGNEYDDTECCDPNNEDSVKKCLNKSIGEPINNN